MKVSEFKVGQTVYIIPDYNGDRTHITEASVTKVGKKYLHVTHGWYIPRFEAITETAHFLYEAKEYGYPALLFADKAACEEHIEYNQLIPFKRQLMNRSLSLQQLRVIKKMIEDGVSCCKDCGLYDSHGNGYGKCGRTPGSGEVMKNNDFCSRAVPKEVNKNG